MEDFRNLNEIIDDLKELADGNEEDNEFMSKRLAAIIADIKELSKNCLGYEI